MLQVLTYEIGDQHAIPFKSYVISLSIIQAPQKMDEFIIT